MRSAVSFRPLQSRPCLSVSTQKQNGMRAVRKVSYFYALDASKAVVFSSKGA
ncbi:MAG: hypothetical protein NT023_25825 [Armatimonadetes bacterium]|nr:hypothetical protein [Armatimonadota bacterium]